MASVLITGGAGFIGSHLTQALLDRAGRVQRDLEVMLSETTAEAAIELAEPAIRRG
jgi:nucleoside-diphosphate-sugar epimerase